MHAVEGVTVAAGDEHMDGVSTSYSSSSRQWSHSLAQQVCPEESCKLGNTDSG